MRFIYGHFGEVVPPLLEAFRPDVMVTQMGIDTHYRDPITHLSLTVQGFERIVKLLSRLAPDRWLALGGGGYDLQAVARAWTLAYGVISEKELPDRIPEPYCSLYGVNTLRDTEELSRSDSFHEDAMTFAESSVASVHSLIFPLHGIRSS